MYVQHWRLTSGCKHGKRLHAQLFPVFGIFKTNSAAPLPYPVWNFVLNRHSRWFNTWIQWMTQEASSSQLNKSRTSRCPSSTPSLCRRPVDVWNYWYTERRHTDQYLHFSSHHPLQHKLSVVRTLLDRSSHIVTEEEDREQEEHHIRTALTRCGYPDWSINQVRSQMLTPKTKKTTRKWIWQLSDDTKSTVVIPYVQDLSEAVSRVYKRHGIPTDMRSFQSIRYVVCLHIPKTSTDHKISVNVSTRYHIRIATRSTLVRLAKHLEYDFRNIDKKSLNVMAGHTHKALADH